MYNNFHTDHIAFAEMPLAVHIQNAINRHIANSGVHITEEEKKAWDAKANKEDLDEIWEALDKKADKEEEGGDDPQPTPEKEYYTKEEINDKLDGYVTDQELECRLSQEIEYKLQHLNVSDLGGYSNLVTNDALNEALRETNQFVRNSDKLFTFNGTPIYIGGSISIEGGSSYVLPKASSTDLGGIKTGFSGEADQYAVNVDEAGNGYVEVDLSAVTQGIQDQINTINTNITAINNQINNLPRSADHSELYTIDLWQEDSDAEQVSYVYATAENEDFGEVSTLMYDPNFIMPGQDPSDLTTGAYVGGMTLRDGGLYSGSYYAGPNSNIKKQPQSINRGLLTRVPTPDLIDDYIPSSQVDINLSQYNYFTSDSYAAQTSGQRGDIPCVYSSDNDAIYAKDYYVRYKEPTSGENDSLKGVTTELTIGNYKLLFAGGLLVGQQYIGD